MQKRTSPKNPDRDDEHARRRDMGSDEDDADGRAVAAALYGGDTSELDNDTGAASDEPTLPF